MICPNCNRTYDDDFNFCPYCKTKKPSPKICPNCEFKTYDDFIFCPICSEDLISEREYQERLEKTKTEERRNQLRKIVENADLTFSSKQKIYDKINRYEITDVIELENIIKKEIEKERVVKKGELRKSELKKCVGYSNLSSHSKQKIYDKIKSSEITNVHELKKYLQKNNFYNTEICFIIEQGTLHGDFTTLINKDQIRGIKEIMSKEELLSTLESFRGKGTYVPSVFSRLTKLIKEGTITTYDRLLYEKLKLENGPYEKDPNVQGHPRLTHTDPVPCRGIYLP